MSEQGDKHVIWEEEQLTDEELEEREKQRNTEELSDEELIDDSVDCEIEDSKIKRAYKSKVLEDGRIEFYN